MQVGELHEARAELKVLRKAMGRAKAEAAGKLAQVQCRGLERATHALFVY